MEINLFKMISRRTALCKASFFLFLPILLTLGACGDDWTTGNSEFADRFNGSFRYYYVDECRYDSFGPYDCSGEDALSPSMRVLLNIQYDGYATLTIDGYTYRYDELEYSEGYDGGRYYYQFYEDDGSMTVYADGSEMIYVDETAGEAMYYYESLY